jgi:hypothetical protein
MTRRGTKRRSTLLGALVAAGLSLAAAVGIAVAPAGSVDGARPAAYADSSSCSAPGCQWEINGL